LASSAKYISLPGGPGRRPGSKARARILVFTFTGIGPAYTGDGVRNTVITPVDAAVMSTIGVSVGEVEIRKLVAPLTDTK
jgi:hypothetical protein